MVLGFDVYKKLKDYLKPFGFGHMLFLIFMTDKTSVLNIEQLNLYGIVQSKQLYVF